MERVYFHLVPENVMSLFIMFLVFTFLTKAFNTWRSNRNAAE